MLRETYSFVVTILTASLCFVIIPANAFESSEIYGLVITENKLTDKATNIYYHTHSNTEKCGRDDLDIADGYRKKPEDMSNRSTSEIITNALGISHTNLTSDQHAPTQRVEAGVWLYANFFEDIIPNSIIDRLKNFGINTIYFAGTTVSDWQDPLRSQMYLDFVCYAYSNGLDVYAVTLEDPLFAFADEDQLKDKFFKFVDITKRYFNTYMIDVEPHTIHFSDPLVYIPQYIRMSLILQEVSQDQNVTYVDTIPFWYHQVIKNIGISSGADVLGGNRVNLMDYSYTFEQSIRNIERLIPEINKPITISIKITPGYGDPFLNQIELKKTVDYLQNHSISYALFESQYLLRGY